MSHQDTSARSLRAPGVLRQSPIDSFQQISKLRRRNRHGHLRAVARNSRRPNKASALQPLRKQAHALAVMPQHLDQTAAPPTEYKQMALVCITLEDFLDLDRQAV